MDTIKINKQSTLMVAHAGLSGMETPNTSAGFIAAGNRSYWAIECDLICAKDGFVIIHNPTTAGASPTELSVPESTVEELQAITLYDKPFFHGMESFGLSTDGNGTRADLRIPTLREYIRICKKYGKICLLELKRPMTADEISGVIEEYKQENYLDGVVFISFHRNNLDEVRRQLPGASVQLLTAEKQIFTDEFLDELAKCGFDLDIHIFTTTKELVDRIHQRGMKVNVWTCDWLDKAEKLVEWGVDYITTNIFE
jgi:glycerophosphoryl diester phosphodiesterase